MTTDLRHSSEDELQLLLHADESTKEFQITSAHVESCPSCLRRLELLSGPDTIDKTTRELLSDYPWDSLTPGRRDSRVSPSAETHNIPLDFLGPPTHPELLGRLGRYEIERVIGVGGMGIVLKAHDTDLNRPVAVKVLARHLAHSGAARQRFARESRAAAAVVHEHVVAIHNVETEGDVPFLVMHFVAGESLQSRVDREGPLDAREILRIGIQAASGLAAAHEQGVVHRDVKPANILLENGVERVLLTDFGLARTVDDASLTQTGVIAGTPHYMSPEQANGRPTDQRTDLFSLGSVLYFIASGHPPFRAERAMGVLNRICHDRQRPLWQVADDVPDELSVLVDRLLQKQPSKRLPNAEAVRVQLTKMLAQIQQPNTGIVRQVRRLGMRYPKHWLAAGVLALSLIMASLTKFVLTDRREVTATSLEPGIRLELLNAPTPHISPVLDAQERAAFTNTLDELRIRIDALQLSELYTIGWDIGEEEDPPTLRSLNQRLERLQGQESVGSQFNNERQEQ